ncbi:alpha-2-macroglobulin-like [Betta splendens]|uniref:Alpha-2-macroglobulin-like n=1 Tax=Betta splendens TaxID=158456 RepID=A0A6P7P6Y8_BETSP|nr:alpha-2-macroglobulin-like [Betta splendens]
MRRPGVQMWSWALCVLLGQMCLKQVTAGPLYMVVVPAVLEAGAQTQFCANLLQPTENLLMTITLTSDEKVMTLLNKRSNKEFNICTPFRVPLVQKDVIQNFTVEVRGGTFYSQEVMRVMFKVYKPAMFIQTDKPIYLPGQTVNFRVVTLDTKLRPVNQLYDTIEIQDVNKNRIGQWLNETSGGKILQLLYPLNSDAREGIYTITVSIGDQTASQDFKVEKYVLPKFGVTIAASDEVSVGQTEITADVCAEYTYGQPVPGSVKVSMCRPVQQYYYIPVPADVTAPCYNDTKQTNKTGCARFSFKMSTFTKADKVLQDVLDLLASVEEGGTGVSQKAEKLITVSFVLGKLSFTEVPNIYVKGSTIQGKVSAVDYSNAPIPNMELYLFEGEIWSQSQPLQNLTTDSNGVATFSFSTKDYNGNIHLYVSNTPVLTYPPYRTPYYEAGDITLSLAQPVSADTQTVSSLVVKNKDKPLPCDTEEDVFIQYTLVGETKGNVDVMYLVLSRGAIIMQGLKEIKVQRQSVNEGEVSFKLKVSPDMAPKVQVVVYAVLPSETVIASSADFTTEQCFRNKVSLEFSPSSAVPGEETTLKVTAAPDSLCGVSAVDQSVLIKEPGKSLDADKIYNLLPVKMASSFPHGVEDPDECLSVRIRRYILPHPGHNQKDAYTVFKDVGLKVATNLFIQMPSCLRFKGRDFYYNRFNVYGYGYGAVPMMPEMTMAGLPGPPGSAGGMGFGGLFPAVNTAQGVGGNAPPPVVTVRTFFPETWIWDLVEVGESEEKNVSLTVPDTITTWETEAFCLSPQGFGLAPRKQIKVFQPFFLELTLPYSIIRGENFELKATVFNYLSSCIMVTVTPAPSPHYTLTPLSGDQYTSCLCGSERKTLSWTMVPSSLRTVNVSVSAEAVASHATCDNEIVSVPDRGRIDVVTKSLIVKAEGTEIVKAYNWLLCPKGEALTEELELQLPQNVIDGSAQASVSVLGDILGRALQNLEGLLRMPYGCGEQNMALLAPNIYILQYLKNTQQLSPDIKKKATNFLTSGYQRQLNYKDTNGAYSTFGSGPGNTWLTAFVMRCFSKAQSFIYIDPTKIEESKTWLIRKQKTSGCFEMSGHLFNNRMKGGVSDEVTLSAYVTAAFLEMNTSPDSQVITKSLSCLKESISDLSNTYTTALLAYVFTLAGDKETRSLLLQHLDKVASKEGGFLYWSQSSVETSASLSVEISSYVLLAKLSASPTAEDLGYCSSIVRWLTGQQNQYGGFSSTQDTVVALQALALYSALVFSPTGSSTVTVQSPSGQLTFDVNQNNKLLYQEKTLQDTTGKYSLEVKGTACASLQISLQYNVPTPTDVTTFSVEVTPEINCTIKAHRPKLSLKLKVVYRGKLKSTNMVILDIKMLSGFVPEPESLKSLKRADFVDRVEQEEDHVLVYFSELVKETPHNHHLDLVQEIQVQNLKPAVVKIYDYYQPSDQTETQYIYPCAAGNSDQ